jgi:glutamyl endopeptidase
MGTDMRVQMRRGAVIAATAFAVVVPMAPAVAGPAGTAGTTGGPATLVSGGGKTVTGPAITSGLTAPAGTSGDTGKAGTTTSKGRPGALPGSVIGGENRVQETVSASNPWGSIVHLESTLGGCTGFLINRDTVVTAGHCVYWNGAWATNYTVTPGRNGPNYKPYGTCTGTSADMWTSSTWVAGYNTDHDYGMVKLRCDVGNSTGWMGWWYRTETLTGQYFYVEGFPGDKPYATMWWANGPIVSQTDRRVRHDIDTYNGQSGAPLYRYRSASEGLCAGWCITGIHTTGNPGDNHNGATRFNAAVMNDINYVANLP